jgi:branched-chain amino acid aminotransferase
MNYICLDGKVLPANEPVFRADNKSYRYGDGLFETMKMTGKRVPLYDYHFDRLSRGLQLLRFEIPVLFTADKLYEQIVHLCEKNNCNEAGRIRVSVFRGSGGLYQGNNILHYLIECWPFDGDQWNENGLVIGIYPDARKNSDAFSNLKSANFLPYIMAAKYAQENKWNDCLVLNHDDRIADATIANVFMVKEGRIFTPALAEGCVEGVMRRYLLEKLNVDPGNYQGLKPNIEEQSITIGDILSADEVFLTNSVYGIRWVKQLHEKTYTCSRTLKIYNQFVKTIWE